MHKGVRRLVLEVQTGTSHAQMGFGEQDFSLLTTFALLPCQFAVPVSARTAFQSLLRPAKTRLRLLQVAGVGNRRMGIGERGKLLNSNVNADILPCFG